MKHTQGGLLSHENLPSPAWPAPLGQMNEGTAPSIISWKASDAGEGRSCNTGRGAPFPAWLKLATSEGAVQCSAFTQHLLD